jgi:hypothetical protein
MTISITVLSKSMVSPKLPHAQAQRKKWSNWPCPVQNELAEKLRRATVEDEENKQTINLHLPYRKSPRLPEPNFR